MCAWISRKFIHLKKYFPNVVSRTHLFISRFVSTITTNAEIIEILQDVRESWFGANWLRFARFRKGLRHLVCERKRYVIFFQWKRIAQGRFAGVFRRLSAAIKERCWDVDRLRDSRQEKKWWMLADALSLPSQLYFSYIATFLA